MTSMIPLLSLVIFLVLAAYFFVNTAPATIVRLLKVAGPIALCLIGVTLLFTGRASIGMPLIFFGGMMLARNRPVTGASSGGSRRQTSTVRSAWLEMQLDHETGDLNGYVLTGNLEGAQLSQLDRETLLSLYADLSGDNESAALLEAYLDRRIPGWRESADPNPGTRPGTSFSAGPMTKEEAYQILGVEPGASVEEIRAAHRRLMKAVHPDGGGSAFLATRINQAKDMLVN